MFREVRPSLYLWSYLGFFASWAWLFSCLKMDFLNKSTGVVIILVRLTIIFSWFVLRVLLQKDFLYFLGQSADDRLFRGYERLGKTIGSALLFFGNIGLYYYSEKSIACMLTFLFLALYCLCALFCIQPYTDFGVLEFLLGASLNQGLCLFGIHSCSFWFVLIACIVVVGLRYWLEPTNKSKQISPLDQIGSSLPLPSVRWCFYWDLLFVFLWPSLWVSIGMAEPPKPPKQSLVLLKLLIFTLLLRFRLVKRLRDIFRRSRDIFRRFNRQKMFAIFTSLVLLKLLIFTPLLRFRLVKRFRDIFRRSRDIFRRFNRQKMFAIFTSFYYLYLGKLYILLRDLV